jgi:hypothetical protein
LTLSAGEFWERVNLLCLEFRGSVTSGIRSKKRNRSVGGVALSWHLRGLAADVVLDRAEDKDDCLHIAQKLFPFVLDEGDHIHLQGGR